MSTIKPSTNVAAQRLNDQTVLVHLRTNMVYTLNETGGRLWALMVDVHDRGGLLDALAHEFDVPRDQLEREVDRLLSHLAQEGLIDVS